MRNLNRMNICIVAGARPNFVKVAPILRAIDKAKALEGLKLRIPAKAAATGKIFGSVNNIQIANAIKEACR